MKIFSQLTNLSEQYSNITVALGTFDGVHIGHQKIISRAVELAKKINGTSVVFTFSNHPLSVINPTQCPLQIVTSEYKAQLIENLGVDILVTIPFTKEFLKISAADFITLLIDNLCPKHIVIGPNYSFGYKSAGNPEMLQAVGIKHGFKVEIHDAVFQDNLLVSSTAIRQLITSGNVNGAEKLLGRKITMQGLVKHGDKRGRVLGFPTINIDIAKGLAVPENGVYAVYVFVNNIVHKGIANIGTNPTFNGLNRHIEVHILNFAADLYGQIVTVEFIKLIRGEITFANGEELRKQILQDIKVAEKYY